MPLPEPTTTPERGSEAVAVLATGLDEPRAIAVHGSSVFIAEKSGAIRLVEDGKLLERPVIRLRAAEAHDGGLVGLAAHPEFGSSPLLYAYMTYEDGGQLWNRIMWVRVEGARASGAGTLVERIPGSDFSNGGAMAFGPDGRLYVGTGSTSDLLRLSQDQDSLAGKILRFNEDGSVPADNPTPGSAVYASGFRDPQGLDWDSGGRLIVADAGPAKNDEISIVGAGSNHGWPDRQCSAGGGEAGYADPLVCFDPGIGPGGIAVYRGGALGPADRVIVASLRASGIYSLNVDNAAQESILVGLGRIRDVAESGGAVYAITSNTDIRGFAGEGDDRLLKVVR